MLSRRVLGRLILGHLMRLLRLLRRSVCSLWLLWRLLVSRLLLRRCWRVRRPLRCRLLLRRRIGRLLLRWRRPVWLLLRWRPVWVAHWRCEGGHDEAQKREAASQTDAASLPPDQPVP